MPKTVPCLWFDDQAEQAAQLYVSLFPNSEVTGTTHYPEGSPGTPGAVMTVQFRLDGQEYTALHGGPTFTVSEAVSFQIMCADQAEIDHYWDGLVADGGRPSQCGWLKDRFGVSWQVVAPHWEQMLEGAPPEVSQRVWGALMQMQKIDIAALERAAAG